MNFFSSLSSTLARLRRAAASQIMRRRKISRKEEVFLEAQMLPMSTSVARASQINGRVAQLAACKFYGSGGRLRLRRWRLPPLEARRLGSV